VTTGYCRLFPSSSWILPTLESFLCVLQVVLSSYIFLYDTYKVFKENAIHWKYLGIKDIDAVDAYIKRNQPIAITKDKRIRFSDDANSNSAARTLKGKINRDLLVVSSLVLLLSI